MVLKYKNILQQIDSSQQHQQYGFLSLQRQPEINNTILIMIRKILTSLIKPNTAFRNAYNKRFFAQSTKQNKTQRVDKQNKQKSQPNQQKQQQKIDESQREEQNQNEQDFAYQKQNRNTMGWWIYRAFFWGTTFTIGYQVYLVANHNKKTPVEHQSTAIPYFVDLAKWLHNEYHQKLKFLNQPPVKKFLPDPIHPSMQGKTLVLNLSGTLLKTDFVFGKGMTLKRRPGLNQFLKRLSQKYEVVIFTDDDFMFLTTAVEYLDPRQQIFMGAFGRESMVWSNGRYIKDLGYLNRDPKNVIVIDKDLKNVSKHPQNAIILKQFQGDDNDNELNKLLPLLESLADPTVKDVRKELVKLGNNPHDVFYEKLQQKKKNIQKKQSGFMGFFGGRTAPTNNAKN